MNRQEQKLNECFVATVAMLTGRPAPAVRRAMLGKELAKESWSLVSSNLSTDKGKQLRKNVERYLARHLPALPIEAFDKVPGAVIAPALDFIGSGALAIRTRRGARHIVAYDARQIFDPSPRTPAPMPAAEYLAWLKETQSTLETVYPIR